MKEAEKRVMKESLGLDPDEDSDLEEEDTRNRPQDESGPLRAVHVSRHKWPGELVI